MSRGSKVLVGVTLFLVVLSVFATFYKTVILQDFEVTGVLIEFPTDDSSYVWFIYDNEEYELELETTDFDEIVTATATVLDVPITDFSKEFLDYLHTAYEEGKASGAAEEEATEEIDNIAEITEPEEVNVGESDLSEENITGTSSSEDIE